MTIKNNKKSNREEAITKIFKEKKFLNEDSPLNFECNACGKCCVNQDIILNTWDILKLKREFNIPTMKILPKYTVTYPGHISNIPICLLKFEPTQAEGIKVCPFLEPEFQDEINEIIEICNDTKEKTEKITKVIQKNFKAGKTKKKCSIHNNSPEVCKLYPLGRGSMMKEDKTIKTVYFQIERKKLLCPDKCFTCKNKVKDYLKKNNLLFNQKIHAEYNLLLSEFATIAIAQKEKFKEDYTAILSYFYNFDFIQSLHKFNKLSEKIRKKIIVEEKKFKLLDKMAKTIENYPELNIEILKKANDKNISDEKLLEIYAYLIGIYKELLLKIKIKYGTQKVGHK